MAARGNNPYAIHLEVEFLDRLNEPVREGKAKSVSEIIRMALERFDLDNAIVVRTPQVPISVRLPAEVRENLKRVAREKQAPISQLVRAAVESYLPQLEATQPGQLEMEIVPPPAPASPEEKPARAASRPTRRKRPAPKAGPKKNGSGGKKISPRTRIRK